MFFVGTSGFASPWVRAAYGEGSGAALDLLTAYSERFDSVEMDSAFSRPPSRSTLLGWFESTKPSFTFCVRMPREVTHLDRLGMPSRAASFIRSLEVLEQRLGCVLFTTPPTFGCDVGRFRAVLDAIPSNVRTAWEFRHQSWLCPEVLQLLRDRGSAPVVVETQEGILNPELLEDGASDFVYVRLRKEPYTYADLMQWGETLGRAVVRGRDVYAFFKQTSEAPCYATALGELLVEAGGTPGSDAARHVGPAPEAIRPGSPEPAVVR
jgi:uncharacterized protein YecE (DUF72 family)